jgi:S1-C subfamily serine protease
MKSYTYLIAWVLVLLALPLRGSFGAQLAGGTTPEIFKQYSEHVVKIEVVETASAAKASIGTGFFADKLGRIVTNYHVISKLVHSPERYRIVLTDVAGQTSAANVLGVDVVYDLAILSTDRRPKGFLALESKAVEQGTRLYSLGHPRDLGLTIVEARTTACSNIRFIPKFISPARSIPA